MAGKKQTESKPLKRSLTGLEIEFFTLDAQGKVVPVADKIIEAAKAVNKNVGVVPECATHMMEMCSFPNVQVKDTALSLMNHLVTVLHVTESFDLKLFPFAVYPGKHDVEFRKEEWYTLKEKLFGDKFKYAGMCCGFHCHYTLPKGVYDKKKQFLKPLIRSKIKQTLIGSYNLAIAIDPALTTLLQSSPFVDGKYLAKDARMLLYRGGKKLKFDGLYGEYQQFGGLPPYKQTMMDLQLSLTRRQERYKEALRKKGVALQLPKSKRLDYTWNPVKINKLGTLEHRGMDMNYPWIAIAASVLIKSVHKRVQRDFLKVMPSDIGLEEPFKIEGDVLYIPPHTYVRNDLQYQSAWKGFESDVMYNYCKRFVKFARESMREEYNPLLKPILDMLNKRQTMSDQIINEFKKKGYGKNVQIPQDVCAEVALQHCDDLLDNVMHAKEQIEKL
jgi:hypothetical protein